MYLPQKRHCSAKQHDKRAPGRERIYERRKVLEHFPVMVDSERQACRRAVPGRSELLLLPRMKKGSTPFSFH